MDVREQVIQRRFFSFSLTGREAICAKGGPEFLQPAVESGHPESIRAGSREDVAVHGKDLILHLLCLNAIGLFALVSYVQASSGQLASAPTAAELEDTEETGFSADRLSRRLSLVDHLVCCKIQQQHWNSSACTARLRKPSPLLRLLVSPQNTISKRLDSIVTSLSRS